MNPEGAEETETDAPDAERRFVGRGDEAGTAPGDRSWRPDVEGLRAIAVLVVVGVHYGVPGFGGGFVGVDVFFVISGFVITGLLLRENRSTGTTSLLSFYARRFRRILPAATVVILVTVLATYVLVGPRFGTRTAEDGIWAAAFAFNFQHFYPGWNSIPSLGNFWSLAVEEQFYFVFPAFFLAVSSFRGGAGFRVRLAVGLSAVTVASYALSITQTRTDQVGAFLSPFTRAWELAVGALVAVATPHLLRIHSRVAAALTWIGLATIGYSVVAIGAFTDDYPGWRAVVPVTGAALIIIGGTPVPRFGAERLIGTTPFRWLGKRSYSLYLWHWPVLIVASEWAYSPDVWRLRVPAFVVSVLLTMLTYKFIENPIRHRVLPAAQTVRLGLAATGATILVLVALIVLHSG